MCIWRCEAHLQELRRSLLQGRYAREDAGRDALGRSAHDAAPPYHGHRPPDGGEPACPEAAREVGEIQKRDERRSLAAPGAKCRAEKGRTVRSTYAESHRACNAVIGPRSAYSSCR